MKYEIDQKSCISCGACVEACKHNGITIVSTQGYASFLINDNCIGCGECYRECLNEAIYKVEG